MAGPSFVAVVFFPAKGYTFRKRDEDKRRILFQDRSGRERMSTVAVIGGGASGMMAALTAAEAGHEVTLFEHGERLGKKLAITGNGRCNLTNSCDTEEIPAHIPRNDKFLYSALHRFDSRAVMDFFESRGLPLKEESSGRVFPASDRAEDVVRTLEDAMREAGVRVLLGAQAADLYTQGDRICGVAYAPAGSGKDPAGFTGPPQVFSCDAVIMATGGRSCPYTGSDGSGWEILLRHGHTVTPLRPALVGLRTREGYISALQGISLHDVRLTVSEKGKRRFSGTGDLLFTHQGISGPLAMAASSLIPDEAFCGCLPFEIDLMPYIDEEQLDARILAYFGENINRRFKNSLGGLLPSGMVPAAVSLTGIRPDKRVNEVTREERKRLRSVIRHFPGTITGPGSWDEAVITRGGIPVREVNPSTLESGLVKGLYLCGEMLDVDALSGGFNLQIAWSTGRLAGTLR